MKDLKIAIQYPSFGPQHPPRLEAIMRQRPTPDSQVVAMEMFKRDSDYEWRPVSTADASFERYTVMDCASEIARKDMAVLRKSVFSALDDIAPDVLVVNGWGHRESRVSLDWCRNNLCKIVLLSDSVRENRMRFLPLELYKKWLLRGIKSGFAAGTPQSRYLEYLGIPKGNVFHPGSCVVDNRYWTREADFVRKLAKNFRKSFALPDRYFLCVARFVNWKNIPFLIKTYALYRELAGNDAIDLVICGSGPDEQRIRSTVRTHDLSNVHLKGFRQINELPIFYSLASCFILPSSRFECWGFVVNEAMASSLPVLVSDMVGSAEDLVQQGINGFTFDPQDTEKLAYLMLNMMSNESFRQKMGKMSAKIIDQHTLEIGAEELWKAVAKALEN